LSAVGKQLAGNLFVRCCFLNSSSTPLKQVLAFVSLAAALLCIPKGSWAQNVACTTDQARAADAETDSLRDWAALHKSFQQFKHYDDGAIAEGYSEAVGRILVDHWKTLPALASLAKDDDPFLKFVLRHIDATLSPDDLKIRPNARNHCPSDLGGLCGAIARRALSALRE